MVPRPDDGGGGFEGLPPGDVEASERVVSGFSSRRFLFFPVPTSTESECCLGEVSDSGESCSGPLLNLSPIGAVHPPRPEGAGRLPLVLDGYEL